MTKLGDMKLSLMEAVKPRLPDVKSFLTEPPEGEYERPVFYVAFLLRKRSSNSFAGLIRDDYLFEVGVEVKEARAGRAEGTVEEKTRLITDAIVQGETLDFYSFSGKARDLRDGGLLVSKYVIREGGKDRQKNTIKADLIITF